MGAGNGLTLPQLIGIVLARIPAGQSGMAAGMLTTAQQFAASAGVTIIGTAFFAVLDSSGYRGAGARSVPSEDDERVSRSKVCTFWGPDPRKYKLSRCDAVGGVGYRR
jgi:hypothetical protein